MTRQVGFRALVMTLVFWAWPGAGMAAVAGTVTVGEDTVAPTSAVAMWSESTAIWNTGARILEIYMAPSPIDTQGVGEALDPGEALREGMPGDFVVLTLGDDGSFSMIYVFIADGAKNYGYNEGVVEIEKLEPGVVSGRVHSNGEGMVVDTPITFDLRFDAEILPERPAGTELGSDGGAPGAAYSAYLQALRDGDYARLVAHAEKGWAEELEGTPEDYREFTLETAKESAPQEMTVTGGRLFDGYAFLTVAGKDWMGDRVEGSVKMVFDGDTWRFAGEDLETVW